MTINNDNDLNVIVVETANVIASMKFDSACCLVSHPSLPIMVLTNDNGILFLLSFYDVNQPRILTELHICHETIVKVLFSKSGKCIVLNDAIGDFYLIRGDVGDRLRITHHIKTDNLIYDFTILNETKKRIALIGITTGGIVNDDNETVNFFSNASNSTPR